MARTVRAQRNAMSVRATTPVLALVARIERLKAAGMLACWMCERRPAPDPDCEVCRGTGVEPPEYCPF